MTKIWQKFLTNKLFWSKERILIRPQNIKEWIEKRSEKVRPFIFFYTIHQKFSTWGTRTPGGTPKVHWGYASSFLKANNLKINSKEPILRSFMYLKYTRNSVSFAIFCPGGTICIKFLFGDTHRGTTLIWGCASTKRLRTPELTKFYSI